MGSFRRGERRIRWRRDPSRRQLFPRNTMHRTSIILAAVMMAAVSSANAQGRPDARSRWERLCQIRRDKFDRILPEAMRENGIDMWIVAMKEGHYDPMWESLGRGYVGSVGYYIFTDH